MERSPITPSGVSLDRPEPWSASELHPRRLLRAKAAYTTRFVSRMIEGTTARHGLMSGRQVVPRPGDVVLARVERIGQHPRIELPDGRRATLYRGDEILVAYGNRYAPDQFEAEVPGDLRPTSLVAAGGVAATVLSSHDSVVEATAICPLGLLTDGEGVVTLRRRAPFQVDDERPLLRHPNAPFTIGVVGTSMNSGKTTTVASIVRGLTAAGMAVAAGKVTGTGAGGDPALFQDAGAAPVLDFTDFGHASTYRLRLGELQALLAGLQSELASSGPQVIVLEIADGLLQRETAGLVCDPLFGQYVDSVVFTAREAMGAIAGMSLLGSHGIRLAAVSGVLTASPLTTQEARDALDVPVWGVDQLADPKVARTLLTPPAHGMPMSAGVNGQVAV